VQVIFSHIFFFSAGLACQLDNSSDLPEYKSIYAFRCKRSSLAYSVLFIMAIEKTQEDCEVTTALLNDDKMVKIGKASQEPGRNGDKRRLRLPDPAGL
jgi:hypothetical protein